MTAPEPLVTIIVPVYNVEAYLPRCLDSLLAQTHARLEIILVDDGSSDRSGVICDDYARADGRIQVLHQANGGLSRARNAGIDLARGRYLGFVDSDDWVDPRYVETLLRLLTDANAQVAACAFVRTTTPDGPAQATGGDTTRVLTPDQVAREFFGPEHTFWTIACAKLYDADLWQVARFPLGHGHEDEFTTYRLLSASARCVATTHAMYFYFQRAASLTGSTLTVGQRRDALAAAGEQAAFARSGWGGDPALLPRALGQLFRKQIYLRRQLAADGQPPDRELPQQMRRTAADLWRLEPGRPFAVFAQAYVHAPAVIDRAAIAVQLEAAAG